MNFLVKKCHEATDTGAFFFIGKHEEYFAFVVANREVHTVACVVQVV